MGPLSWEGGKYLLAAAPEHCIKPLISHCYPRCTLVHCRCCHTIISGLVKWWRSLLDCASAHSAQAADVAIPREVPETLCMHHWQKQHVQPISLVACCTARSAKAAAAYSCRAVRWWPREPYGCTQTLSERCGFLIKTLMLHERRSKCLTNPAAAQADVRACWTASCSASATALCLLGCITNQCLQHASILSTIGSIHQVLGHCCSCQLLHLLSSV
jgi:hypothetical protein